VEIYYERLLKLANNLQHKTTNSFLITIFKSGLQPHLHVIITGMKRETMQHKEATLVYEEGFYEVEAINNLLVPHNIKIILCGTNKLIQKSQKIIGKIGLYCTNYHKTNHNVENYRFKRKEDFVPVVSDVTTHQIKIQRLVRYSCHICGDTGHMFNYKYWFNSFGHFNALSCGFLFNHIMNYRFKISSSFSSFSSSCSFQ